jgi:hypothetical protein
MAAVSTRFLNLVITADNMSGAALGGVSQNLTNLQRVSNNAFGQMGRQTGLLSQQFAILRRSMEYAVSGVFLYKFYEAVSNFKNFRSELGQLNTTLNTTQVNLNNLGQAAIQVSNQTAQPLNDILQSFQNIAQTYPSLPQASIPTFSKTEAITSQILGAQPQDVGSAIGALSTAFYGRNALYNKKTGPTLINRIADMLVETEKRAGLPNLSGEDLLSAMETLVGGAKVGRFTLPQAISYFDVIEQQLASPTKASQYLRQLMSRIITPTTSEAAYYSEAGLPSGTALAGMTGNQIVQALVKAVINQPGSNMTYQQAVNAGFKNIKIGPQGIQLLEKAIGGRIQSGIAANLIVSGFGRASAQQGVLNQISNAPNSQVEQSLNTLYQAWLTQNELQAAGTKISNLSTQLLNNLNPLIQRMATYAGDVAMYLQSADKYLSVGSRFLDSEISKIPFVGKTASSMGAGGILEALGLGFTASKLYGLVKDPTVAGLRTILKTLSRGKLGGKVLNDAGDVVEADISKQLLQSKLLQGGIDVSELGSALIGQANGSPESPFWVVIAPLSMQTIPFLSNKGPTSAAGGLENYAKNNLKTVTENIAKKYGIPTAAGGEAAADASGGKGLIPRIGRLGRRILGGAEKGIESAGGEAESIIVHPGQLSLEDLAKTAAAGAEGDALKGILGGIGLNAVLGFFTNTQAAGGTGKAPKGMGLITAGGFERTVPKNNLAYLLTPGAINPFADKNKDYTMSERSFLAKVAKLPEVQKGMQQYAEKQISLSTLDRLIRTAAMEQKVSYFASGAGVPTSVLLPDSIQGTFLLEPTPDLENLIKPQVIRKAVPVRYSSVKAPAPTSKGGKPTSRSR